MGIYGVTHDGSLGTLSFKSLQQDNIDPTSDEAKRTDRDGDGKPDTLEGMDPVSLSSMSMKLSHLTSKYPQYNIVDTMAADLELLKTGFMESLEEKLQAAGVDVNKAFTLKADKDGTIRVDGEHPDKEAIEEVLNGDEKLKTAFGVIAEQGKMVEDVRGNSKYKKLRGALDKYKEAAGDDRTDMFLVSLQERTMRTTLADYL